MKSKRRTGRRTASRPSAGDRDRSLPGWLRPAALAGAGLALAGAGAWFARQKLAGAKRLDPTRRPPYASTSTRTHAA